MANIAPFQAWRYDSTRVSIAQVITQPYDKITAQMQERYYTLHPNNLVRIILGKHQAGDGEAENVYSRAAASFCNWRKSGILRQDRQSSIYRYAQTFKIPGTNRTAERVGFIALCQLEDYSAGVVYRHELTHSKPKADRLDLLRATRAHFEQIFFLYSGSSEIDALLQATDAPEIDVKDEYDVTHRVWQISDPARIAPLQEQLRDKKLIIADGHHRYETALNYRNERRATAGSSSAAPYDSTMVTFFNMESPSLVVLPTHRVVFGLPTFSAIHLENGARQFFSVEAIDRAIDATRAATILREAGQSGTTLLAVTADRAFLMHTPKAIGTNRFAGLSLKQQSLDVVQLHKCLLEGVLKISEEAMRNQQNVAYYRDADEALAQVRSGQAQAAFLMNPVRVQQIRDIAFAGEVLPQKSTDFYPKLLSGLTIYAME